MMDLGDRIEEFSAERKIYYDGECFQDFFFDVFHSELDVNYEVCPSKNC